MFKIFQKDLSKYRVVQLEAENEKLKDELIDNLRSRVRDLEERARSLNPVTDSYFPTSDQEVVKVRPVLRTMSEVADKLEQLSAKRAEYAKKINNPS